MHLKVNHIILAILCSFPLENIPLKGNVFASEGSSIELEVNIQGKESPIESAIKVFKKIINIVKKNPIKSTAIGKAAYIMAGNLTASIAGGAAAPVLVAIGTAAATWGLYELGEEAVDYYNNSIEEQEKERKILSTTNGTAYRSIEVLEKQVKLLEQQKLVTILLVEESKKPEVYQKGVAKNGAKKFKEMMDKLKSQIFELEAQTVSIKSIRSQLIRGNPNLDVAIVNLGITKREFPRDKVKIEAANSKVEHIKSKARTVLRKIIKTKKNIIHRQEVLKKIPTLNKIQKLQAFGFKGCKVNAQKDGYACASIPRDIDGKSYKCHTLNTDCQVSKEQLPSVISQGYRRMRVNNQNETHQILSIEPELYKAIGFKKIDTLSEAMHVLDDLEPKTLLHKIPSNETAMEKLVRLFTKTRSELLPILEENDTTLAKLQATAKRDLHKTPLGYYINNSIRTSEAKTVKNIYSILCTSKNKPKENPCSADMQDDNISAMDKNVDLTLEESIKLHKSNQK